MTATPHITSHHPTSPHLTSHMLEQQFTPITTLSTLCTLLQLLPWQLDAHLSFVHCVDYPDHTLDNAWTAGGSP